MKKEDKMATKQMKTLRRTNPVNKKRDELAYKNVKKMFVDYASEYKDFVENEGSKVVNTGNTMNEIIEALKECEYALKKVIETGKVGWLQEEAHKSACAALEAEKSNRCIDEKSPLRN